MLTWRKADGGTFQFSARLVDQFAMTKADDGAAPHFWRVTADFLHERKDDASVGLLGGVGDGFDEGIDAGVGLLRLVMCRLGLFWRRCFGGDGSRRFFGGRFLAGGLFFGWILGW